MANMSYCRFENTYHDLVDCEQALEDIIYNGEEISKREMYYAKRMKELCEEFLDTFNDLDEDKVSYEED
jgi:hypothetical protein